MSKDIWISALVIVIIAVGLFAYFGRDVKEMNTENNNTNSAGAKTAILKTNLGSIEIEFFENQAPLAVANFLKLVGEGFYNGTKFHRVIKDFMIQGGDPNSKGDDKSLYGMGGPGYTFADEQTNIKLVRGIMAMANAGPNTNGSQFFIITAPETSWLNGKHTPFARVISGMDVVDKIEATETGPNDIPLEDVILEGVVLE